MNIIFLDIDGVLNSLPYFDWLKSPQCTQKKNPVYNENAAFHLALAHIYDGKPLERFYGTYQGEQYHGEVMCVM